MGNSWSVRTPKSKFGTEQHVRDESNPIWGLIFKQGGCGVMYLSVILLVSLDQGASSKIFWSHLEYVKNTQILFFIKKAIVVQMYTIVVLYSLLGGCHGDVRIWQLTCFMQPGSIPLPILKCQKGLFMALKQYK